MCCEISELFTRADTCCEISELITRADICVARYLIFSLDQTYVLRDI